MPPLLALAPLAGSLLGAEALPGLAGLFGADLGGAGLLGSTLGETLGSVGGAVGGGAAGALTNKKDPALGGALGAVGGSFGGPSLAGGVDSLISGGASALGLGGDAAAGTAASAGAGLGQAASGLTPGAAGGLAASGGAGALGASGGSAAATAAPAGLGDAITGAGPSLGSSLDPTLGSSFTPTGSTAGVSSPGASLTGAPAAAPPVGGSPAAAPTGTSSFDTLLSDPTWKNLGHFAGANKDLITSGIGLGATALQGDRSFPGESQIKGEAKALGAQGRSFMSGQLTPGMQAGLRGATESAKATMRSMFASRGMSGSSSEAEALANIDQTSAVKGAEIAQQLIDRGISESQLSGQLWQQILQQSMARDEELGKAIGGFASSLAH